MATETTGTVPVQSNGNSATPTSPTSQDPIPTGLLGDPTASAIHDAFLIGWSLTELKSRIQVEVLKIAATAKARQTQQGILPTLNNPNTTPSPPATAQPAPSRIDTLLEEVEKLTQNVGLRLSQNETFQSAGLTSEWRSLFSRIASIQNKRFHNSTTVGTSYDPPADSQLSYLHSNYADTGIVTLANDTLAQFRLYDVTRRTLNCLTLLYTNTDESLIPDLVSKYQWQLVHQILNPVSSSPAPPNGTVQPDDLDKIKPGEKADDALDTQNSTVQSDDLDQVIIILSGSAISLLNAWDGYLRENYYTGGYLADNELELLAYEGGRSLATLSWCVTIKVEPVEKALSALQKSTPQGTQSPDSDTLRKRLNQTWMDIFNERDIIHIQHQIAALKSALDDAYYRTNKQAHQQAQPSAQDTVLVKPDLNLPSNALKAVSHSLDYWRLGVAWICNKDSDLSTSDPSTKFWEQSEVLRIALIEQSDIWQSLILCQQNLQSFSVRSVTQKILNNFMAAFQQFAVQGLSQAAQGASQDIANATNQIKKDIFRENLPILLGASIVLILVVVVLFVLLILIPDLAVWLKGIFSALLTFVLGALGFGGVYARNKVSGTASTTPGAQPAAPQASGNAPTTATSSTNLLDRLSSFLGSFGSTIMSDFDRGYQQILIEFDSLNHNVSVAFPFIEFFITSPLLFTKEIKDGYNFLTTVIWTEEERAHEIERIAQAAFGPLGAVVGAQLQLPSQVNGAQPAKPANSTPKASPVGGNT